MTTEAELFKYLEHHGIKGQRWGVRRNRNSSGRVSSGPDISKMSDQELRTAVSRMQLEKQFRDLSKANNKSIANHGADFAKSILKDVGKQHVKTLAVAGLTSLGVVLKQVFGK